MAPFFPEPVFAPNMQKVLVIVGPTASGKSALAVELARAFDGEVISADSRQVYRGLDIGTGKITKSEMRRVPHHLLDISAPSRVFTADDFVRRGRRAITDIAKRGKLPIICGGTGFYIDALIGRISLPNVLPNKALRAELEKLPTDELFQRLQECDPARAETIDPHNARRIIRALEIADAIGQNPVPVAESLYNVLWIGIAPEKEVMEKKIHVRLLARMKTGMLAEAKRLHAAGLSFKRMHALGLEYGWLADLLQEKVDKPAFIEGLFRDIRAYAKRQITYWKRNENILWFRPEDTVSISAAVAHWLRK